MTTENTTLTDSQLFNVFQPICVELTKELNRDNLLTLKRALHFTDRTIPGPLQEYLLFPLRIIVKVSQTKGSQEILQLTIECITSVLEKSVLTKWELLSELVTILSIRLSHSQDFNKIADISEELKLNILKCIEVAFEHSDNSVIQRVYSEEFLPQLAHLIVTILNIAEKERARSVRVAAVNILTTLTQCQKKDTSIDMTFVSATFATFIPKISTTLVNIILGDSIQGHLVTVAAMEAWMNVVSVAMSDKILDQILSKPVTNSDDATLKCNKSKPKLVEQNETWIQETAFKLNILINELAELVSHSHWKIAHCLAELAADVFINCSKSLSFSSGKLLDILVTLTDHEIQPVSKRSRHLLKRVIQTFPSPLIFEMVEDNLYELVSKLPRIVHNSDDSKILSSLSLLAQYLRILGHKVDRLVGSHVHLKRLASSLLQLAEMDCSDVNVVALKTSIVDFSEKFDNKENVAGSKRRLQKVFKYFLNQKIYEEFEKICCLLGRYSDVEHLTDHFLDIFMTTSRHRKEAALIMNKLLLGASGKTSPNSDDDDLSNLIAAVDQSHLTLQTRNKTKLPLIIKLLLDEYLRPSVWSIPVSFDESEASKPSHDLVITQTKDNNVDLSVAKLNSNIYQICILIEGVGNFSQILESDFNVLLLKVLYPLLDKMGSSSAYVSHTAFHTADVIATSTGKRSIAELIEDNADYLVDSLSLKLHHILENPSAPRILRVAVQNTGLDIFPLIKDSVEQLLNELDNHHGQQTELFVEALGALVVAAHASSASEQKENRESSTFLSKEKLMMENDGDRTASTVKEFFLNYHQLKEITEENLDKEIDQTSPMENLENEDDEAAEKEVPYYVNVTVEILERCVHIMASENIRISLHVLDAINSGISALEEFQDELLPVVHKLWSPLIGRYLDGNPVIIRKAFSVICTLANVCGDFVSKRTLKDVWPKMVSFLESQAKISLNKDSSYCLTSAFKLQTEMLSNIGMISTKLRLPLESCDSLIRVCLLYLNCKQPQELQTTTVETLNVLNSAFPDVVWLWLKPYVTDEDPSAALLPHECFQFLNILKNKERENFVENIKKIF